MSRRGGGLLTRVFLVLALLNYHLRTFFHILLDEYLEVHPWDHPSNSCEICPNDFCKGAFMDKYIGDTATWCRVKYDSIVYVGELMFFNDSSSMS